MSPRYYHYGWYGFDLDGTLAVHEDGQGLHPVGEPVKPIQDLALRYVAAGYDVRIFTARACNPKYIPEVEAWCLKHLGKVLPVTNQKDFGMICFYDDRARQVEPNTGVIAVLSKPTS